MRIRPQQVRILAAIALQRASERELRMLYDLITDISPLAFFELVRNIEDEIDSAISMAIEHNLEHDLYGVEVNGLYKELERIRREELRLPVYRFAELLTQVLLKDPEIETSEMPSFDSRRGLETWISRLIRVFSEQKIYGAVLDIRRMTNGERDSTWKLR